MTPSTPEVFVSFLRLGLTAFGGPAMAAYIRKLAVDRKKWLSEDSFNSGVALCQSIPGATAMQTAAYVGLRVRGVAGAVAAYVGFGLPGFLLMLALSALYDHVRDLPRVVSLFSVLQVVVVAILANATVTFGRTSLKAWQDLLLTLIAVLLLGRTSPILAICACAALALLLFRSEAVSPAHTPDRPHAHTPFVSAALALCGLAALGFLALFALNPKLFDLSWLMMKVNLFAFGGGFASLPLMLHEVVEARGWLDPKTFMDGIALGQTTPGPIVITATFVGYRVHSLAGAAVATVSVFFPSFVLVLLTVPYFDRLQRSALFRKAVRGALTSFVGLLLVVTLHFAHATPWTPFSIPLAALALLALQLKVDILWVVLGGGLVSILLL